MMSDTQPQIPRAEDIAGASAWVDDLRANLQEVLVGQDDLVRSLTIGLLTGGHILLEGVPGLAKSLAVSCLAQAVHASFNRLQFTPDLLPSDLVGTEIYDAKEASFTVRKGPIFANFVLADEINRAPAKVQSALLEGMQERTVSIGGETFELPRPFMVLATQNPIEQEGTYPLPEAQLDRFALKVVIGYPGREEELEILDRMSRTRPKVEVKPVVDLATIERARELVDQVAIDARLAEYIVAIVEATREQEGRDVQFGEPGPEESVVSRGHWEDRFDSGVGQRVGCETLSMRRSPGSAEGQGTRAVIAGVEHGGIEGRSGRCEQGVTPKAVTDGQGALPATACQEVVCRQGI